MKNLWITLFLLLSLLMAYGCSTVPAGTDKIVDLHKNAAARLGQNVTVVGIADVKTPLSSFRLFKLYQGQDFIWVSLPEDGEEPPQGFKIRVAGVLQQGEFTIIGNVYYIAASKITYE